jgi:hypothetical protein
MTERKRGRPRTLWWAPLQEIEDQPATPEVFAVWTGLDPTDAAAMVAAGLLRERLPRPKKSWRMLA